MAREFPYSLVQGASRKRNEQAKIQFDLVPVTREIKLQHQAHGLGYIFHPLLGESYNKSARSKNPQFARLADNFGALSSFNFFFTSCCILGEPVSTPKNISSHPASAILERTSSSTVSIREKQLHCTSRFSRIKASHNSKIHLRFRVKRSCSNRSLFGAEI